MARSDTQGGIGAILFKILGLNSDKRTAITKKKTKNMVSDDQYWPQSSVNTGLNIVTLKCIRTYISYIIKWYFSGCSCFLVYIKTSNSVIDAELTYFLCGGQVI